MPWNTDADVERHKKGLTAAQKSKWRKIANAYLKKSGDEAAAIRIANAAVSESMSRPILRAGYLVVAQKIQEAATMMSHDDIRQRLADCLNDKYRGTGTWCYVVAVFGDDSSGDVVYSCDGDLCKAPYTCSTSGATIDTEAAKDVVPLTTYEEEPAEIMEAGRRNSSRDMKQLQAIHDASSYLGAQCGVKESTALVRDRAISADSGKDSASGQSTQVKLFESAATLERIVLREAKADYEIKLIAPGKGSSAFYPAEVLKRDGPKVFGAGTHVYLNHPTAAEEAARPEGDVSNLAGVLTTAAAYHEAHAKGPGLYARMKVFADHAQMVEEKAPHVGMSIRASGIAEAGRSEQGVPVLKELTRAESVDVVTRAGAGGMILTESARPAQEESMTKEEVQALVSEAVKVALTESRKADSDRSALEKSARTEAARVLSGIALHEAAKQRVIEASVAQIPVKDGALDIEALKTIVTIEAQHEGEYLSRISGGGRPVGLGPSVTAPPDPKLREAQDKEAERELRESTDVFISLGLTKEAAVIAARGRVA